jgi:hypothetical protein
MYELIPRETFAGNVGHDFSVAQHRHLIGVANDLTEVVSDQEYGNALGRKGAKRTEEFFDLFNGKG